MDIRSEIQRIVQPVAVGEVSTFEIVRQRRTGDSHMVDVRVTDWGMDATAGLRFSVVAVDHESDNTATGNSAETLEQVLATLHWWDLDKDLDDE